MFESQAEAVLRPSSTAEVSAIMRWAHEHKVPVVPMGGNTGLCGGATTSGMDKAIILSLERMKQIRHFDAAAMTMEVEAGCILEELHKQAEEADLFFPLYFGARGNCMIGGNLSTNAGGSNVLRYGNTRCRRHAGYHHSCEPQDGADAKGTCHRLFGLKQYFRCARGAEPDAAGHRRCG